MTQRLCEGILPPEFLVVSTYGILQARIECQARIIERQAEQIALLEQALAPPGRRGLARLRRSPWWVRAWRRLLGPAA